MQHSDSRMQSCSLLRGKNQEREPVMKPRGLFGILLLMIVVVAVGRSQWDKKWLEDLRKGTVRWDQQADTLGRLAFEYRMRPKKEGGGGGSFIGFIVPERFVHGDVANFSVYDAVEDEIVLRAAEIKTGFKFLIVFDEWGKKKPPENFTPERLKNHNEMAQELYAIIKKAQAYRSRTVAVKGALPTYEGFSIPEDLVRTPHATYSLEAVSKDLLIFRAVETRGLGTDFYKADEKGKLRLCLPGEYRPKK
jgi:hypothetical protein